MRDHMISVLKKRGKHLNHKKEADAILTDLNIRNLTATFAKKYCLTAAGKYEMITRQNGENSAFY